MYRGLGPVVSCRCLAREFERRELTKTVLDRRRGKVPTRQSGSRRTAPSRYVSLAVYGCSALANPARLRLSLRSCAQNFVAGNARPGESLPAGVTFGIGAIAGVITVYTTMPLE